jgi:hypothetical protein
MWKGKFLRGSTSCEVYVNVYQSENQILVECRRVKGECEPFYCFYKEFKAVMTNNFNDFGSTLPRQFVDYILPSLKTQCSCEQFMNAVEPIFLMAHSPYVENQREGAKMLCDLTDSGNRDPCLQTPLCVQKVVTALLHVILDSICKDAVDHAMMALSNVCDIPGYRPALLSVCAAEINSNNGLLVLLFDLVSTLEKPHTKFDCFDADDGLEYQHAQTRREAARILQGLVTYDATAVRRILKRNGYALLWWMRGVDSIGDDRLKRTAYLVRERLAE